jgi:hypothetical protein
MLEAMALTRTKRSTAAMMTRMLREAMAMRAAF